MRPVRLVRARTRRGGDGFVASVLLVRLRSDRLVRPNVPSVVSELSAGAQVAGGVQSPGLAEPRASLLFWRPKQRIGGYRRVQRPSVSASGDVSSPGAGRRRDRV